MFNIDPELYAMASPVEINNRVHAPVVSANAEAHESDVEHSGDEGGEVGASDGAGAMDHWSY
jgi:hypothetical protein